MDRDMDLVAEDYAARLALRRAASLRGTWDQPGEYLDSAHEEAIAAEEAAREAAEAEEDADE